ncbi:MAG: peptide chain release factor 2 [Syntrophales bacterium]
MSEDLIQDIGGLEERLHNLRGCLEIEAKEDRIRELDKLSQREDLWSDPEKAKELMREKTKLLGIIERIRSKGSALKDLRELNDLAVEEGDEETLEEIRAEIGKLERSIRDEELKLMLGSEQDPHNAIVTIHAGAGGTEAQDWVEILLRMYLRWAERRGYTAKIIDILAGEEAGLKSVTFTVEGDYAYGYMKAENGIHRLVRISPFDAGSRRHTSFASVFVYPEIDDEIVIDINEKDLRIDTYRSQGAGGQHVNKTDSAVRITHIPTGIIVQCQNERSQHKNRATAMKVLKSRLYELKMREQSEKRSEIEKTKKDIAWGSQIRSYVLQPYKMVKDHRTNKEIGNVGRVLDGDIDDLIEAFLLSDRPKNKGAS